VKFAVCNEPFKPDLVISGPNDGENTGVATAYSGTLAGAREAALWGIPAIAVSLQAKNEPTRRSMLGWVLRFLKNQLHGEIKQNTFWSVNFPDAQLYPNAETKWCSQSLIMYEDQYLQIANDTNSEGYMLSGRKPRTKFVQGTDDEALYSGKITVSPLTLDQTDFSELRRLQNMFLNSMNQNV
jgi:5'-nucleotidase